MNININLNPILCALLFTFFFVRCERNKELAQANENQENNFPISSQKLNGVNLVATSSKIDSSNISPLSIIHANSVAIVPFGFIRSGKATVEYNLDWQWHGEKIEGTIEQIKLAKKGGLSVLLKPHLWTHDGWVGDLNFETESDWKKFETSYAQFIIDFAQVADSLQVEHFCIGVELKQVVIDRPAYWESLIDSIRSRYSGNLTYAANWDNYSFIPFWSKLDFIGVEAYFPLSEEKTPSIQSLVTSWKPIKKELETFSAKLNKPILFTEFGYRNIDFTGRQPWNTEGNATRNDQGQGNAYSAIFETYWSESWFAGGYLWKWYPNHEEIGKKKNNRFTPQNKPAEQVISNFFEGR